MKYNSFKKYASSLMQSLSADNFIKTEIPLNSITASHVGIDKNSDILLFGSNNYLGLATHPRIMEAARRGMDRWGFGISGARYNCGTSENHLKLESALSQFHETESSILFSSCFDANEAVFEALLSEEDAVISDKLNHASIINGIRLSKAHKYLFDNNDMTDLERKLQEASHHRLKVIATEGIFSMDGLIGNLDGIAKLAEKYGALVMVDESHSTGVIGKKGRGAIEHQNVMGKVEIITSTFGKAFGGQGGFITGKKEVIDILRQKARHYLYSNSMAPYVVEAHLEALKIVTESPYLLEKLAANIKQLKEGMIANGFEVLGHPDSGICPILIRDEQKSNQMSAKLLEYGVFARSITYPVCQKGKARIRVQVNAAHSEKDIDRGVNAFVKAAKDVGLKLKQN